MRVLEATREVISECEDWVGIDVSCWNQMTDPGVFIAGIACGIESYEAKTGRKFSRIEPDPEVAALTSERDTLKRRVEELEKELDSAHRALLVAAEELDIAEPKAEAWDAVREENDRFSDARLITRSKFVLEEIDRQIARLTTERGAAIDGIEQQT